MYIAKQCKTFHDHLHERWQ
ncbi:hypothetical protein Zm00014a_000630 [Zea mays]|uniref:Uncharacterized protein n=1 Tax=Zea mays TaxID=4577 RepID=A0A3L6E1M6_MAIZE|nr:hypothetical protein Zm00014a_000630 [Zea mays]